MRLRYGASADTTQPQPGTIQSARIAHHRHPAWPTLSRGDIVSAPSGHDSISGHCRPHQPAHQGINRTAGTTPEYETRGPYFRPPPNPNRPRSGEQRTAIGHQLTSPHQGDSRTAGASSRRIFLDQGAPSPFTPSLSMTETGLKTPLKVACLKGSRLFPPHESARKPPFQARSAKPKTR